MRTGRWSQIQELWKKEETKETRKGGKLGKIREENGQKNGVSPYKRASGLNMSGNSIKSDESECTKLKNMKTYD